MSNRGDSIRVTGRQRQDFDIRQLAHLLARMARRRSGSEQPVLRRGVYRIDGDEEGQDEE